MRLRGAIIGIAAAIGTILIVGGARAADTVSDYVRHGWKLRAWGSPDEPVFLLQKAHKYMICDLAIRDNPPRYVTAASVAALPS